MKNYYYVVTLNMTNPNVNSMLDRLGINAIIETMIDFKLRSRLFISYRHALEAANADFEKKVPAIFHDVKNPIFYNVSVPNPDMVSQNNLMSAISSKISDSMNWDPSCCNVLFFTDTATIDEDEESAQFPINSWMFKYEIYFTEDSIELSGNGDYVFSRMNSSKFTSTYQ